MECVLILHRSTLSTVSKNPDFYKVTTQDFFQREETKELTVNREGRQISKINVIKTKNPKLQGQNNYYKVAIIFYLTFLKRNVD